MAEALARHDQLLRAVIARHRGHVFKTVGDAVYAVFSAAGDAAQAACAIQLALAEEDFTAVNGIRVRIALHAGSVERRDNDFFGPPLNRVARLLSIAHGGQIVVSTIAAALIRSSGPESGLLRDLGRQRLKDLTQPEQVFQLVVPGLPQNFPPLRSIDALPNNLPEQLTSFVGREAELAALVPLIGQHRLVTLLGTGGLGKTRLSLQVAAEVMEQYPDGVWLAELAPLTEPPLVEETVAGLFGLSGTGERQAGDLLPGYLREKKLLLILDNCEHLVAAAASLAGKLLRACAQVSILASSREVLGIRGEQVYRVPPLASPVVEPGLTAADAYRFPAVRLLVDRAASSGGQFELDDDNAADLAAICRRLDGIALAIELAAARLRLLKPKQLLARLDDRFRILTGGDRTALPRQQTLRALIDWSHELLSPAEQVLMRRLAVFAGSFSLESAAAVTAGEPIEEWEVLDLLGSLVDKSLVATDPSGTETRYHLFESTRAYAAEKLAASGESGWIRRLAEDLTRRLRQANVEYETVPTGDWVARYGPEIDNLRAALDWAFGPDGDGDLGLELQAFSGTLWAESKLGREWRRRLDVAAARLHPLVVPEIIARIQTSRLTRTGLGRSGIEELRKAVATARRSGQPILTAWALVQFSIRLLGSDGTAEAVQLLEEARALVAAHGATKTLARVLSTLGVAAYVAGDLVGAEHRWRESLSIARSTGDRRSIDAVAQNLAELLFLAGDLDAAITAGREALAAARETGNRESTCPLKANLAAYLLLRGDSQEGSTLAAEALAEAQSVGESFVASWAIQHLALAAARANRLPEAARLQGFVEAAYAAEQTKREPTEQATCNLVLDSLSKSLDPAEIARFLAEGAALTLEQAGQLALSLPRGIELP